MRHMKKQVYITFNQVKGNRNSPTVHADLGIRIKKDFTIVILQIVEV